jgi:hypothetical protein
MKIIPVDFRRTITRKEMRAATDSAWLRLAELDDQVRLLQVALECIGRYVSPRHRPEFLRVLQFIRHELPMTEESITAARICLDVLAERYRNAA